MRLWVALATLVVLWLALLVLAWSRPLEWLAGLAFVLVAVLAVWLTSDRVLLALRLWSAANDEKSKRTADREEQFQEHAAAQEREIALRDSIIDQLRQELAEQKTRADYFETQFRRCMDREAERTKSG